MLQQSRLHGKLREFCDKDYAQFRAIPTHKDQARQEWAAAFADYFDQAQEDINPAVPGHPSLVMSGVQAAFYADLGLEDSISAPTSAADFAGAWRAGVNAVTPGPPVAEPPSTTYTYLSWSNVTTLHATLLSTLTALFSSPSISLVARLGEIATAFHTATDGLVAAVTITVSGTPSAGTMGIK